MKKEDFTKGGIEAMKYYMKVQCDKNNRLSVYNEQIDKDPLQAWMTLCLIKVVVPGFIKYFKDYDWELKEWINWKKVKLIKDDKFKAFTTDEEYKLLNVLKSIYKSYTETYLMETYLLVALLNKLGHQVKVPMEKESLEVFFKVMNLMKRLEINHDINELRFDYPLIIKDEDGEMIIDGNHRLLAYAMYSLSFFEKFKPIKAWCGVKKNGKNKKSIS